MTAVWLVLSTIACQHRRPHKPGDESLKAIEFEGNREFSDDSLRDGLALRRAQKAGRAPDLYQMELDTDRVKSQYVRAGFFEADVQSRIDRDADTSRVIYKIEEGERSVTRVRITGLPEDPDITAAKVREKLPLADGEPFHYDVYDAAKVEILGAVQDAGYAHATLDANVQGDVATHTANVTLAFTPGPKCRFGTISVVGTDGSLRDAILNRLQFASGQTYSTAAIANTQRAIYGLQRFSTVQVQPAEDNGSEVVDVQIAVTESSAHQVELGGGLGIEPTLVEVRGRAGYAVTRWPLPLQNLTIDLRPAYAYLRDGSGFEPRMRAMARLEHQDLFTTYGVGSVEVGYDYLAYEAFTEYGPRAQVGYEMRLGSPKLKLAVGYLIHRYGFRNANVLIDPALQMQLGIDRPELVGGFVQSVVADFRDQPVEPRIGVYAELKVIEGTSYAGSDYEYQQLVPELRGYVPAGPVVVAARARYGTFLGDIPPTERFYAGGSTSQRGFSERELSPSVMGVNENGDTVTVPYGGGALVDSSVEARFPITTIKKMPLGGVVFLDGADVTEQTRDLDLMRLHWAAGLGLRLKTIVGPVRADLGYRLNRVGPDEPGDGARFAFHLSLGEAF